MPVRAARPALPRHFVTAVVVAHDGERWLPATLTALLAQTRMPQRLVAVDTGSRDASADLLAEHLGGTSVLSAPRGTGFGAAVQVGLDAFRGVPLPPDGPRGEDGEPVEWVWLLHDDCAPAADALERLLALADATPSAAVVGPKVRDWYAPQLLVEIGLTTDRAGHRHTGLERREVDQGQHDGVGDVLAVGSAGALVRRDVWNALGGYDPRLPLFRDDLDFGWRARLAGHRVVVAPDAVVLHAQAAARGHRRADAAPGPAGRVDRRHALYTLLANASAAGAALGLVALGLDSALRALALLFTRRPRTAVDEVVAYAGLLRRLPALRSGRRARARAGGPAVPRRQIRPLFARPGARLRAFVDHVGDRGRHGRHAPDPRRAVAAWRRLVARPGLQLFVGLAVVACVAERHLLGGGLLLGGRLLPPPGGAADLWRTYTESWHAAGLGSTTAAPPYLAALALVATLLLGKVWLAVDLLLLGAVPLAGLSAYAALRWLGPGRAVRTWAAATYALLPVVTGVVSGGRLGAAVGYVLLPQVLATGGLALADAWRGRGWRRAWLAGVPLAAATAFAPDLYPIVLIPLAVAAATAVGTGLRGRRRRAAARTVAAAAVVAAVPIGLLLPWSLRLWTHPAEALAGVGPPAPSGPAAGPLDLLLGHPGGPGLPARWVLAPLLAAALAATVRRDRPSTVFGWVLAAAGVAVGLVETHAMAPGGAPGGAPVGALHDWAGLPAAAVGAGLIAAAVRGAAGARQRLSTVSFGWRQLLAGLLAAAAVVVPVLCAAGWLVRGTPGPVALVPDRRVLPVFVAEDLASSPGVRALVLRGEPDGGLGYALAGAGAPTLAAGDLRPAGGGAARLDGAVRDLLSGPGRAAAALATMGVRYVVVSGASAADAALGGQPGLVRSTAAVGVSVWQVLPTAGGLAIHPHVSDTTPPVDELVAQPATVLPMTGERTAAHVPAGSGGVLTLAAPADGRWRATLDGRPLPGRTAWGWSQAFTVPPAGGRLVVDFDPGWRTAALWFELGFLVLVLILAAPSVRDDEPLPGPGEGEREGRRRAREASPAPAGRRRAGDRPQSAADPPSAPAREWVRAASPAGAGRRP